MRVVSRDRQASGAVSQQRSAIERQTRKEWRYDDTVEAADLSKWHLDHVRGEGPNAADGAAGSHRPDAGSRVPAAAGADDVL